MDGKKRLTELINDVLSYLPWGGISSRTASECADHLLANGVTVKDGEDNNVPTKWIPASEPPTEYRDEYGELIPFLVCEEGTEYPFRAMYDGKVWGDGWDVIPVKYWMPLPEPPKENNDAE